MQEQAKKIVDSCDYLKMVSLSAHPLPGEYVITGLQAGNMRGEQGWDRYLGYVVQVRKKAGAFGSDIILLRHPDGALVRHENQAYFRLSAEMLALAKTLFTVTPDQEDYAAPYTLGNGEYPEIGQVIEAKDGGPPRDNMPMAKIMVQHADGSRTVELV